ncbi:MAG: hypothetical protein LBU29_01375 [Endomicrobium sp.]|jgi:hypothetical protein|nr:hypothetical protein [Endomicrobium sp.]
MKNIIIRLFQRQKNLKNNRGQTLYYFLIFISISIVSLVAMLNIAQLIRSRITMQNEADNIAVSLATYKARVLNFLGEINYFMGLILSLGMNIEKTQEVSYSTDIVGGFPATMNPIQENFLSDVKHGYLRNKQSDGVEKKRQIIEILQTIQEEAIKNYFSYYHDMGSKKINCNYDVSLFPAKPEPNLGLKRNAKGIQYYSIINDCIYLNHGRHLHSLQKSKYKKNKYSWFVEGSKFSAQKIRVVLRQKTKNGGSLFARLLRIQPLQITVYSAASPYNVEGSMFPKKEGAFTGVPKIVKHSTKNTFVQKLNLPKNIVTRQKEKSCNQMLTDTNSDEDNPIDAYLCSKTGGWTAHLVPYNGDK